MNDHLDGRLQVKAVNTHDGFAVDEISLRAKVDSDVGHRYGLDEDANVLNGGKTDPLLLHDFCSFLLFLFSRSG